MQRSTGHEVQPPRGGHEFMSNVMSEGELVGLVGYRFPGGHYRVAHWENFLLTDCTGREPMPDGLVHPIVLFHAPILGAGTSIAELFRLGGASGAGGSVGLLGYDWEYEQPIVEDVDYRVEGGIVSAERRTSPSGAVADDVAFRIELSDNGALVARVTNRWRFRRTSPDSSHPARMDVAEATLRRHGDPTVGDAVGRPGADEDDGGSAARPLPGALGPRGHRGPRAGRSSDQPGPAEPGLRGEHADGLVGPRLDQAADGLVRPTGARRRPGGGGRARPGGGGRCGSVRRVARPRRRAGGHRHGCVLRARLTP